MSSLSATYQQLARPWTREELAAHYRHASQHGGHIRVCEGDHRVRQPIVMLAMAIPACATLSAAVHVIHVLPDPADPSLLDELFCSAEKNAAVVLHRSHRALELDGLVHDYSAQEWLPAVCDIAAPLLKAARLDQDPPSLVELAQEAVHWTSRAIIELEEDAPDASAAITEGLGRILAVYLFLHAARMPTGGT